MRHRWLLVVAGVAALIVVAVIVFLSVKRKPPSVGESIHAGVHQAEVPTLGEHTKLNLRKVWVVRQKGFTAWRFYLLCVDPGGCRQQVRLTFHYLSRGEPQTVAITRSVDLARGGTLHDGFLQRPPRDVERVTSMEIKVLQSYTSAPEATPLPW